MGAWFDFTIGHFEVLNGKNYIPPEVLSVFLERDKLVFPEQDDPRSEDFEMNSDYTEPDITPSTDVPEEGEAEEEYFRHTYQVSVADLSLRLDVMGFTMAACRIDYEQHRQAEIAYLRSELGHFESGAATDTWLLHCQRALDGWMNLHFDTWLGEMKSLLDRKVELFSLRLDKSLAKDLSPAQNFMVDLEGEDRSFFSHLNDDIRYFVRGILSLSEPTANVNLDYTELVQSGYVAEDSALADDARAELTNKARPCERIIVLTEGPSDTRILKSALDVLFPHLAELYSFLDHQTFSVQGGASSVLSIAKAMAGARVANRIVGILDNDTAGTITLRNAQKLSLPPNIRMLQLPFLPYAQEYPTLGPNGLVNADVNLSACGIEMYCGLEALRVEDGTPMPVQWTGYEKSLQRYQGELLDKAAVQRRFFERLGAPDSSHGNELNAMRAVLEIIFRAFA